MLKAFRILFNLIIIFIFLVLAGIIYLRTGLPRTSGTLLLLDLEASVEIIRDRYNVPHIYAENNEDAYFGLGFVHAQDRLWQMEFQRRLGAGRLSEFIGEETLKTDKFYRTLSVYHYAKASFENLDAETQSVLQAYTKGVNAYLENHSGPLPPEFLMFKHKPEPWQPADSLVWLKMMAWDLSNNWEDEILRARLSNVLSDQEINQLFAPYSKNAPTILPDFQALYKDLALDKLWTSFPEPSPPGIGSNAWVVSGEKTTTGKPLLANDPHLRLEAPSVWYFAHIKTPDFEIIGATLPGLPAIVLGHNNFVAWGIANVPADNQDLFIERLDPTNENFYLTPNGKERFTLRSEKIKVKGQNFVNLEVRQSNHGPIISDASDETNPVVQDVNRDVNREFEHVVAFSWTALREDDLTLQAGLNFSKAKNVEEFASSLNNFHSPHLSIVYADVEGNIGYYAPARVPLRANGDGLMPIPGWTGEYDWQGFIPFEELPHTINPASGQIVSANHKIVGDDYPYLISSSWTEPYRAKRIEEMLADIEKHTPESFAQIQADQVSLMAKDFLPLLLKVIPESPEEQEALENLQKWDGRMLAGLAEPLIFYTWYQNFSRLIYIDELGEELFNDTWGFRPIFLESVLSTHSKWCNNILTFTQESCEDIVEQAFNDAFEDLTKKYGNDMSTWQWGNSHKVRHAHNIFSRTSLRPLHYIFDINKVNGGDAFTVNVGRFDLEGKDFTQTHGATLRAIYDLANLDNSRFMHTTGQSGHPLSLHYRDFARKWLDVDYIPMNTVQPVVKEAMIGKLVLKPLIPR